MWRRAEWNSLQDVCVCAGVRAFFFTSWEYEVLKRNIHKQKEFASKQKVYSFNQFLAFICSKTRHPAVFSWTNQLSYLSTVTVREIFQTFRPSITYLNKHILQVKKSKLCSLGFKTVTMKPGLSLVQDFCCSFCIAFIIRIKY